MKPSTLLKTNLNRLLQPLGLEITRKTTNVSGATFAERLDHAKALGLSPRTVIDVGVASGTPELYATFPLAKHVLIEPLEEYKPDIEQIMRELADSDYVAAAATHTPGQITIHVHPFIDGSSLYLENEDSDVNGVPRTVPAITLDGLCAERQFQGPYLIKADVQGAELDVLRGAETILADTDYVSLEVSLFQFFEGGPQFYDVVSFMKEQGFVVYDVFSLQYRLLDSAMSQVDIAFVQEHGFLRHHHHYATTEQRRRQHERSAHRQGKARRSDG